MNILLVAYYFPPLISGGSQRPVRMLKHLTRLGNRVTVLAPAYEKKPPPAPGLIHIFDPSYNLNRRGMRRLQWLRRRLPVEAANRLGCYNSIYAPWLRHVLRRSDEILRQAEPEILLATYPPVETLQIGLALAQKWRLPLVADFRDGLMFEPVEGKRLKRFACLRREYQEIEATIASQAAAIVTISPTISAYFERAYSLKNVFTIPNGYDGEITPNPSAKIDLAAGPLHVVHAGKIALSDSTRSLRPFIAAVERLRQADGELALKLQLHFVGELSAREKRGLQGLKKAGIAHLYGARDHSFSLAVQQKADLFLLITSAVRPGIAPGKLFEYLAQRKPILALDDNTHAGEIVHATNSGWIVPAHDVETIAATLEKIIHNKEFRHVPAGSAAAIGHYAAARQMEQLNGILQQVRSTHGNRP